MKMADQKLIKTNAIDMAALSRTIDSIRETPENGKCKLRITTSMVYHAAVRGIHIEQLESQLEGDIDLRGFTGLSTDVRKGYQNIRVTFHVKADTDNMNRLRECASFSPVFDTVRDGTDIEVNVEPIGS